MVLRRTVDQGPRDPRAHAGHNWGPLGTPLCLCFLLMTSAKFSPPIEVYSDSSWGDDLRASMGSVWLPICASSYIPEVPEVGPVPTSLKSEMHTGYS